jgi:hypothetical protein
METIKVIIDKDWFTFLTFLISTLILIITAIAVWKAPIKAVEIGRKLSDKQNKYDEKMRLFLTLFSLRGMPLNYEFVLGLNQIEIVFQESRDVIDAWRSLHFELLKEETDAQRKIWESHRVSLLSKMALDLGYKGLHENEILKYYYPVGFDYRQQEDSRMRKAQLDYYERSADFFDFLIEQNRISKDNQEQLDS